MKKYIILILFLCLSLAQAMQGDEIQDVSMKPNPVESTLLKTSTGYETIYRLSELYHLGLFGPDTWMFLDMDETLLQKSRGREEALDPDFIQLIKSYSDPASLQNPRAMKFFILTARSSNTLVDRGLESIGLSSGNFSGIILSPGNNKKGGDLLEFLRNSLGTVSSPKRIIFTEDLLTQLDSVRDAITNDREEYKAKGLPSLLDGIDVNLFHINARTPTEKIRLAAGVFLYMNLPDTGNVPVNYQRMCAVLVDRNYGENKDTFSNPGGLVDPEETAEMAAAREATEELGEAIKLTRDDLHVDRRLPEFLLRGVAKNTSDAGFGSIEYHMYFKQIPTMTASEILGHMKAYKGHGSGESNAVAIVPLDDLKRSLVENGEVKLSPCTDQMYAHKNQTGLSEVSIRLYPQMVALLNQPIQQKGRITTIFDLLEEHVRHSTPFGFDPLSGKLTSPKSAEEQMARTIAFKAQLSGELRWNPPRLRKYVPPKDVLSLSLITTNISNNPSSDTLQANDNDENTSPTKKQRTDQNPPSFLYIASDAYLKLIMGQDYDLHGSNPVALIDTFFNNGYTDFLKRDPDNSRFDTPRFREILAEALIEEEHHQGCYVFYHGTEAKIAFMYDILSTYLARFQGTHAKSNPRLRFLHQPFVGLENLEDFKEFFSNDSFSFGRGPLNNVYNYPYKLDQS